MTSTELISDLRALGPQDLCVVFQFLADHLREAELNNGRSVRNMWDFEDWLKELTEAAKVQPCLGLRGVKA